MDFFKNCATNVQHIDSIGQIPVTSYIVKDAKARSPITPQILAGLRQEGVLVTSAPQGIWVFGTLDDTVSTLLRDLDIDLHERGTLDSHGKTSTASELLLDAVESAISYSFLKTGNTLHLAPRTWLCCADQDISHESTDLDQRVLLQIRPRITDEGSLVIATDVTASYLHQTRNPVGQSRPVVLTLAPMGCHAQVRHERDENTIACGAQWRTIVMEYLVKHEIAISDTDDWVMVQSHDISDSMSFLWPAKLCFEQHRVDPKEINSNNWRHLFAPPEDLNAFTDPLRVAEEWFKDAAKRDELIAAYTADRKANAQVSTIGDFGGSATTSPPFLLRIAEQQAIAGGIYPTPPDGLAPGPTLSHQPSSDAVAVDHTMGEANAAAQESGLTTDQPPLRVRASSGSDRGPELHSDESANDLFGDMDEEMDFGGDEIGDADFDFFNEEDRPQSGPVPPVHNEEVSIVDGSAEQHDHLDTLTSPLDMQVEAHSSMPEAEPTQTSPSHDDGHTMIVTSTDIRGEDVEVATQAEDVHDAKPLSPFAIKERLLPPPIPASANVGGNDTAARRSSAFDRIAFKDDLSIGRRFSTLYGPDMKAADSAKGSAPPLNISTISDQLERHAAHVPKKPISSDDESGASTDEPESPATSVSDAELPPRAPWNSKKRKRSEIEPQKISVEMQRILGISFNGGLEDAGVAAATMEDILRRMVGTKVTAATHEAHRPVTLMDEQLRQPEQLLQLSMLDVVYVAQLVAEQAVTCVPAIVQAIDMLSLTNSDTPARATALQALVDQCLVQVMPTTIRHDITSLALSREPIIRNPPSTAITRPGQPRPPQRIDNTNSGPDIIAIPAPYVRVQRGNDKYEMLPPALQFWDTLSLAPANGAKDVQAFTVFPQNEDLRHLLEDFVGALGASYEERKLGSHSYRRAMRSDLPEDEYMHGMAAVYLSDTSDMTLDDALRAYAETCESLGIFLPSLMELNLGRTIVIYMINPFHHPSVHQHLCACFWLLYQRYRDALPKSARNQAVSDVVLQILPIDLIASPDKLVTLQSSHFASLAHEVYDRCPPSSLHDYSDLSSALPDYTAPSFELASPPPKRISFQLFAEPPGDLLHEGSVLHLAYALSADGFWLTAAWTDSTGRYQKTTSFALCGRTFADVAGEVWEVTVGIMSARQVGWRVFIVVMLGQVDDSIRVCWRETVERARKQPFSVTLLVADLDPVLKLSPPILTSSGHGDETGAASTSAGVAGFLTPGSTPQASAAMTVSPDPSGSANPPPATPSQSETPAGTAVGETDPDAHLIDLTDETWAVLFSPSSSQALSKPSSLTQPPLATGALYKRGEASLPANVSINTGQSDSLRQKHLPSMAVSILWTIQVRPNGTVDEGNVRQAEMTLREVLRMYRSLSVLSRARGLVGAGSGGGRDDGGSRCLSTCVPVHLVTAVRGAEALDKYIVVDEEVMD